MKAKKYLSAQEVADSWGISKRRVQNLCVSNRILGAVRIGNMWAIPFDAKKPKDARIREHEDKHMPIGTRTRKARRELKSLTEVTIATLQQTGLSPVEALYALVVYFAAKLLNEYVDDSAECLSACEQLFDYKLQKEIPHQCAESIAKYIAENTMCLDDSLSWIYQFGSKKSELFRYRDTQFFTEKYMISTLVDSLELDSTSIVIDPACGGANFLLYAFDRLIKTADITTAVIERVNSTLEHLLGYEIDRFLAHVATFNLKLKALDHVGKATQVDVSMFNSLRTKIYYPQIVTVSGFLDLEWTRQQVINCNSRQVVELVKAFDGANVVITNPPFRTIKGMPTKQKAYLQENYPMAKCDMCNAFIQRIMEVLPQGGKAAMVTQNSWMYLDSFAPLRRLFLKKYTIDDIWELGSNAFYDLSGEKANVILAVFKKATPNATHQIRLRNLRGISIEQIEEQLENRNAKTMLIKQIDVSNNAESRFDMFSTDHLKDIQAKYKKYKEFAVPMQGTSTGDAKNLIDYYWRHVGDLDWVLVSKGGGYSRYEGLNSYCVKWGKDGEYIRKMKGSAIRNASYFDQTQLVFSDTGTAGLNVRVLMPGQIFVASGPGIRIITGNPMSHLAFLNSRFAAFFVKLTSPKLTIAAGYVGQIPVTEELLNSVILAQCAEQCLSAKARRLEKRTSNIEFSYVRHKASMSIQDAARTWFEEDLNDEWTQLIHEQAIEDEITKIMCLNSEDKLAIDNYIGSRIIRRDNGESKLILDLSNASSIIGCDCFPKRTKANKRSLGTDGIIEYIAQSNGVSCEQAYSVLKEHYEWFSEQYTDMYLHSLILSALDFANAESKSCALTDVMIKTMITAEADQMLALEWVKERFNKVHTETFMGYPLFAYIPEKVSFLQLKE